MGTGERRRCDMMPTAWTGAALLLPSAAPVPVLAASVAPRASSSSNHVSGTVSGSQVAYSDLYAAAWFKGGGRDLRNRRRLGARGLSGLEDTRYVRRW